MKDKECIASDGCINNHYYPFGLTMAGISSKTPGVVENKKKANGGTELDCKEFSDGSGLESYSCDFRKYDAQIGRFNQIDPLSAYMSNQSSYSFVQNNPISFIDPQGLDTIRVNGEGSHKIKVNQGDILAWTIGKTTSYYTYDPSNQDAVNGFVGGGIQSDESMQEAIVTVKARPKERGSSTYELASKFNWGLGTTASAIEGMSSSFRLTNGVSNGSVVSPKYYASGWGGGSRAGIKTFKVGKVGHFLGEISLGVGIAFDGYGVYKYYKVGPNDPNAVHPAKMGLNTGMGAYGLWVNPIAGVMYFGVDAFYPGGWPAASEKSAGAQNRDREILGYYPKD